MGMDENMEKSNFYFFDRQKKLWESNRMGSSLHFGYKTQSDPVQFS